MAASINRHCRQLRRLFSSGSKLNSEITNDVDNLRFPKHVFSGVQPTGDLHIGNYFGAVENWVKLQDHGYDKVIYCIVDLHSITMPQDPKALRKSILDMTACLLACGVDPTRSILFQQSSVPAHAELSWILGCHTTMARLARLPMFKEKSGKLKEVPLGLYVYPILQSADILLYKTTGVPIGEDNLQHLYLTQTTARLFNNKYGECFPIPHALQGEVASVRSLRNPAQKMSKSDPDPKSRINLTDTPDQIRAKVKKALTDFTSEVTFDPANRPALANLIAVHSAASGLSAAEICARSRGLETAQYKMAVADALVARFEPIRGEMERLSRDVAYLRSVLDAGAERAAKVAEVTLREVKHLVGFD